MSLTRRDLLNDVASQMLADPYPVYHYLRRVEPVLWSESWQAWFLTRYDDLDQVMKDPRFSVSRVSDFSARLAEERDMSRVESTLAGWLLFMDPPRHTRMRGLISKAFTPKTIARMADAVAARVDMLCDRLAAQEGPVDLMSGLASLLPVMTIADILGGRADDRDTFADCSHRLATFLGNETLTLELVDGTEQAIDTLEGYFARLVEERRKSPTDDLISTLLAVKEGGEELSDQEIVSTCVLLFAAGHDTTTNLIGNSILALLQHPEEKAKVVADPEGRAEGAVEETLRWDSPSQIASRSLLEDVELGGRLLRKGQSVNLCMGAANRDPDHFEEPDRFNIERSPNRHISFGKGIHFCVGAPLARLEARLTITALFRRWPALRLAGRPDRYPTIGFRRLKQLKVRLVPK